MLVGLASDEELATGVDAENTVEFLLGDVLEMAEGHNAGVRADNVQLAVVLDRLVEHLDRLLDIANIGLDGVSVTAARLDVLHKLLSRLGGVGVVDDDFGTTAGQLSRHGGTDTPAGARHERDLAIEAGGLDGRWGIGLAGGVASAGRHRC